MAEKLLPDQLEINRLLMHLDDATKAYEAVWGYGRLELLVSPATKEKWNKHWDKLNAAILDQSLAALRQLVDGACRGWAVLDAEARKNGHKPGPKECWEAPMPGTAEILRVYKNLADARTPQPAGYVAMSLDEIANIVEIGRKRFLGAAAYKDVKDIPALPQEFFDKGGDKLPF